MPAARSGPEAASRRVIERLRRQGHQAYWVGGCVRDLLLGRPVKDWDVATSALPEAVRAVFPGSRFLGRRFGVVAVELGEEFTEVATFRRECGYSDGRRPDQVSYTVSARADVARRDFTINGMLLDPESEQPIDHVGGRRDLDRRLVRAIGDPVARFQEDRLRMLRACRFAARLGFEIEAETMDAVRACADGIRSVAAERVRGELSRILTEGGPRRGFELLEDGGLLERVLPEIAALRGVEQPPEFHPEGDVWTHTMLMLDELRDPSVPLAWGVLLHDVGKPGTFERADRIRFHGHVGLGVQLAEGICSRLRFSNAEAGRIQDLVRNHMKFMDLTRMRPGKRKRFLQQPHFDEHLELHRVDCLSSHGDLDNHEYALRESKLLADQEPVAPLITGHDLKAAGYVPGPVFGTILRDVEDRHLDGRIASQEEALQYVKQRYPAPRR